MLANNKFSQVLGNCQNLYYDMYVHPTHQSWWEFFYIRPYGDNYDPDSSEPWDGSNCESPFMEDILPAQYNNIVYTYAELCPLLPQLTDIVGGLVEHGNRVDDLADARALYALIVDASQKTDIEAEINNAFPMESNLMRNYLLARTPLSDEIMKQAIDKYGLLDSWHLTQVLLANSPLSKEVLVHLESTEVLNSFFMSFLYDAQITGAANYRKLLEYEIAAREAERHNALAAIIDYCNTHADQLDIAETLKPIMLADGSIEAKTWLLDYYIAVGDEVNARTLQEEIGSWKDMADYAQLKDMQINLMNDWSAATASQISDLEAWVANPASSASGPALAVLHGLGLSDAEVEPEVPEEDRAYFTGDSEKRTYQKPEMSAYPNPASGITYISYPTDADGIGNLVIYDPLGQQVRTSLLNTHGIYELDTKNMASGVYLLQILVEGKTIAESKLVVLE
jgi:hypothetical protein